MKSVQLVFTLALLACLIATTALAGSVGGKDVKQIQGRNVERLDANMSDVSADAPLKFGTSVRVEAEFATPAPAALNAAAMAKYPNVSAAGLTGVYTIPGDFPSIASAVSVLNFVGLSGNTTFRLTSTSYSELASSVVIGGSYPGAGTYGLTISPALGKVVTVTFLATTTAGKGFAFNGAKNVTLDGVADDTTGLTLAIGGTFPTADPFGSTVYITGGADNIAVKNTTIKGVVNDPVWENQTEGHSCAFVFSAIADPAANTNITFDNDTFINGTFGLKVLPEDAFIPVTGLTVTNSKFGGAFGGRLIIGAWTDYAENVTWTHNQFKDLHFLGYYWDNQNTEYAAENAFGYADIMYYMGQLTAFHHIATLNATVAYNVIDGLSGDNAAGTISYGTRTYEYSTAYPALVHHNRITNIFADHASQSLTGIRGPASNVYHNSVRLTGTKVISTTWASTCLNGVTRAYNNAFSNEILGGAASTRRGVTAGGTIDYNAIYSSGDPATGYATVTAAVGAGVNPNGIYGPVSFDADLHITAGATAAKEIGKPGVLAANDIDGTPIDTTIAGKRDAGADQFSPLGTFVAADVMPTSITSPPAGGVPKGVPVVPAVNVKNNSQTSATFGLTVAIAPDGYSDTKSVTLNPGQAKSVLFAPWTPATAGPRTLTATSALGGDAVPANDVITRAQPVDAPVVPPAMYTFDATAEGWTATTGPSAVTDWKRSSTFTKLGGVNGGSGASWVTERPTNAATYTEGAYASTEGYSANYPGPNLLTSPWLDISGFGGTNLYISFQHSIESEPAWDRSWLQYTVDGITWKDLGVLNDINGINWYNEALYQYAELDPANFDDATSTLYGFGMGPLASWTSNDNGSKGAYGSGVPLGPTGYVYAQLKATTVTYPDLVNAGAVRFRYVAFSDAVGTFGGWAFDNFKLSAAPPIFSGGTISGHAFQDLNGDGIDNGAGEPDYASTKVYVSLFGSVIDSVVTNGTGDYTWSGVSLPAAYQLKLNVTGVAYTVPFGVSGIQTVSHPADASTKTANFGTFVGGVAGKKYSDLNDNGVNDSEPGLAGWTIQVHKDSATGALMGSAVTDVNGAYSILLPAYVGNYVATEVTKPTIARQTGPVGGKYTFTVDNITPLQTAKDFGNFLYGRLRVTLNVDLNGNGVKDVGDIIALPSGASSSFKIQKDGVGYKDSLFTLGNGSIAAQFDSLTNGVYTITEVNTTPGWRRTKGGVATLTVNASGMVDTAEYLDFKYLVISGTKYNDLNGNGVKDAGEPGLAGWTVNVSGGVYYGGTTAVTDVNGDYSIDSVFTGTHTVAEVGQPGWVQTSAPLATINGISGNLVSTTGKNFGNFDSSDISGLVYRDYNGNGVKDPEDVVMPGVTITLVEKALADVTDGSGYSFSGVLTTDSIAITVPGGFVVTQPLSGGYRAAILSGGAALNKNFGLFQTNDSTAKYRTFTAVQLGGDDQKKPGAKPKVGKVPDPVKNHPTSANLVDQLLNPKTGFFPNSVVVGLSGQMNAGGKEKAYVKPDKQGSFWASLNNKGVRHTNMARGFDVNLKGQPFLKLQKSFPPNKKQNNKLFAELLALQLNLVSSGKSTPAGLGVLIYNDANSQFDGMTIDEIAGFADTVMTNYEFMPLGVYNALDTVVAKINGAFSAPAVDDTLNGWSSPWLTWKAYTSVFEVPFLKPNPGATPKNRHIVTEPVSVPTAFALEQNYPNPFNPTTIIEFTVPQTSIVTLKVYNLLGQEVATLLNKQEVDMGDAVEFDASSLPSGVYLYRIVAETIADKEAGVAAETFTQVKKMVLVK